MIKGREIEAARTGPEKTVTGATDRDRTSLQLRIILPTRVLVDTAAIKIRATGRNGSFCLLPRHVDTVTALVPCVLEYQCPNARSHFVALDEGILVKCQQDVTVCAVKGLSGPDLTHLREQLDNYLLKLDERERSARAVLAQLEASTLRQIWQLEKDTHD